MTETIYFTLGIILGVILMRYSFGLGVKSVYQIKEDKVLDEKPIEQESTNEYEEE